MGNVIDWVAVLFDRSTLAYWRTQTVLTREGGERRFNHPIYGQQGFLQTTLLIALQPDWKLVCLQKMK